MRRLGRAGKEFYLAKREIDKEVALLPSKKREQKSMLKEMQKDPKF